MVTVRRHLVLQHLVSDDDEWSRDSAAEEDDEPREQGVSVVDVNRQCLQEQYKKHFIIVQCTATTMHLNTST